MIRRHLDIETLRALVCIVDHGGFSAAAEQLGRTQSAVSLQIKRLEQALGQTVLQRAQGRVDGVTAEGAALLAYARQILRLNDEAYAAVAQDASVGSLRVGLPEELMESVFPTAMTAFRAAYPRLRLSLRADTSAGLRRALAEGLLDLAVVKGCGDNNDTDADDGPPLWQESLVWMVGESFRDSGPDEAGLPLALFGDNCVFRLAATAALARAGLGWTLRYTGSSTTGLRHAVRAGLGLTALPRSLLAPGLVEIDRFAGLALPGLPPARVHARHAPGAGTPAQRLATWLGEAMAGRDSTPTGRQLRGAAVAG